MTKKTALNLLSVCAALLVAAYIYKSPGNFAECVLYEIDDSSSSLSASSSVKVCRIKYPEGLSEETKGSGLGFLGYKNMYECMASKAKGVHSTAGQSAIAAACRHLYEPKSK